MCPALFLMMRAACFLRAYAGAPVTRTLHTSLLRCGERPCDTLRAHPENAARYRCAAPLLFTSCGSVVREISPVRWVRRWFSMCAPCLANWRGGGCRLLVCCLVAWRFACGAGESCRLLACYLMVGCFACRHTKARHRHTTAVGNHFKKSQGYRTGQIRVTNSRKSSTSLPCSNRPTPKRVATSALSSNDK